MNLPHDLPPPYRSEAFPEDLDPVQAPFVVDARGLRRWPTLAWAVGLGALALAMAGAPSWTHAVEAAPHTVGAAGR